MNLNMEKYVAGMFVAMGSITILLSLAIASGQSEPLKSELIVDPNTDLTCKSHRNIINCQKCCTKAGRLADLKGFECVCFYYAPIDHYTSSTITKPEGKPEVEEEPLEEGGLVERMLHDKHLAEHRLNWELV